jgi:hypothetical protein
MKTIATMWKVTFSDGEQGNNDHHQKLIKNSKTIIETGIKEACVPPLDETKSFFGSFFGCA